MEWLQLYLYFDWFEKYDVKLDITGTLMWVTSKSKKCQLQRHCDAL